MKTSRLRLQLQTDRHYLPHACPPDLPSEKLVEGIDLMAPTYAVTYCQICFTPSAWTKLCTSLRTFVAEDPEGVSTWLQQICPNSLCLVRLLLGNLTT